jgi:hypothetical protein
MRNLPVLLKSSGEKYRHDVVAENKLILYSFQPSYKKISNESEQLMKIEYGKIGGKNVRGTPRNYIKGLQNLVRLSI